MYFNEQSRMQSETTDVNGKEPVFFPFCIKTSKCSGSCNNINDPYEKLCVPMLLKI